VQGEEGTASSVRVEIEGRKSREEIGKGGRLGVFCQILGTWGGWLRESSIIHTKVKKGRRGGESMLEKGKDWKVTRPTEKKTGRTWGWSPR